ncbi:MAG: CPBP family intramembrane metalloprotease [Deltaproteobacteria bacterium]|nr:CPBP family intramembrane metalloprotease [Deltaproteobacteria bacterium]
MPADPTRAQGEFARPLGPMAAALWSAAFLFAYALMVEVVSWVRPGSDRDGATLALLYTAGALLVLLAIARVHAPEASLRVLLGVRPVRFVSALLSALMGACAALPLGALEDAIAKRAVPVERAADLARDLASVDRKTRIAGVLAVLFVAPIADELIFRGALVSGVARDRGKEAAILATTLGFAFVSSAGNLSFLPVYLALGALLAHARLSTGSVLAAIGAHLALHGVEVAVWFRAHHTIDPLVTGDTPKTPALVLAASAAGAVACALLLWRFGEGEPLPATGASHSSHGGQDR